MSQTSLCSTKPNILWDSGGNLAEIGDLQNDGAWAAGKISVSW